VLISGERTGYLIPKSQDYVTYMVEHIKNDVTVITAPEEIQEPVIKVSYFIPEQYRQSVTEKFQEIVGDTCLVAVSGNEWVDFAPLGTSKGSALAAIGEGLGIDPAEMAAFGDNENDRSMLELVGHPYLMKNCNPTMEDLSAIRCSSVEEELKKLLAE
jgi:HAD superfamily hydrolase (TIGR01484 family)